MPLVQASHDSLPYIDPEPSPQERHLAQQLLAPYLPRSDETTLHPSIPALPTPHFPPLISAELTRLSTTPSTTTDQPTPAAGIDTSRYESPAAPAPDNALDAWRSTLRQAYATSTHLHIRAQSLALLERFGKNAWLVGNAELEALLRAVEAELVATRSQVEGVNRERKEAQERVRGELHALSLAWREGVGRVIETEAAAEKVRLEILARRRELARRET